MKIYQLILGPIQTNVYVPADENGICAVIDPAANADEIINLIEHEHLKLTHILLTHGHPDHIGGLKGLKEKYPEAKVLVGKDDEYRLTRGLPKHYDRIGFDPKDYEGLKADILLEDGYKFKVGDMDFDVFTTPGHTQGGVVYRMGGQLFTGDTLFHHDIGRTDLEGGNFETLIKSLKKIAKIEGDYIILPGHEEEGLLSDERVNNPYLG